MEHSGIKAPGIEAHERHKGEAPDERWVTDITYILTHEGWLYLTIVIDLFSRKVIGWSMQPRKSKDIVLNRF
ncbi:hypothetical protein AI2668V1_2700 [Citrobacter freundii]|nr:hypothetical protein AI2666V1_2697 [Citrobacter freundii]CAE7418368.1 hypothetical protein AI2668V1_2700 [Citrobacter freundii]CAH3735574.1 hypothetical protein AI2668V1_2700 [Citrobacter freundii]CAH3736519.1 hypothetical protein AI2666V1_2697 [Citrobacter freundii]CAH3948125.1 hypothetical protein AI2680V1_4427 [Citrobacter freundii]